MARTKWKTLGTTLCMALCFPLSAAANPALSPAKPTPGDIPKVNYLGERIRGFPLPAAVAFRQPDGEITGLYGYIVGKRDGTSNYAFWNKSVGVECHGKTQSNEEGYRVGEIICTDKDRTFMRGPFVVVPEKYKNLKGDVRATLDTPEGAQIRVNLAWRMGRFPKLNDLLADL
ncbi:MAG: hypothetical protein ABJL99_08005 [Aliishimia sp.]